MSLLFEDKIANINAFEKKVREIAYKLGIDVSWLMLTMDIESGLNSKAVNSTTNATGLIQFLPSTALGLGTSVDELKSMTNVEQLDYVYKYLKDYKGDMRTYQDVYLAVFYPAAIGKPSEFTFPKVVATYNSAFDLNKDGYLTISELNKWLEDRVYKTVPTDYYESFKKKEIFCKSISERLSLEEVS